MNTFDYRTHIVENRVEKLTLNRCNHMPFNWRQWNILDKNYPRPISGCSKTKGGTLKEYLSRRTTKNPSVIRHRGESQNGGNKKAKHTNFSEKRTFLTPWYTRVRGVRYVRFSENFVCFSFLLPPFWDSPFCLIIDESTTTETMKIRKQWWWSQRFRCKNT